MRRRFTGLWQNQDFVRLWAAQTVSLFGSLVTRTALPFTAILVLDASPFQVALLTTMDMLPGFLVGLPAGVWVDRLRRRPIMIAADLGRAALLATVPVAALLDVLHIEQLYAVAFLAGILTVFFDVAYLSYLPSLVRREELLEGNSKLTASGAVAEAGAFSLAGWLVQLITAPLALLVDAASFLLSAFFVGRIRTPEPAPTPAANRTGVRREIAEGVRAVLSDPLLRVLAGSNVLLAFSTRIIGAVFLLYASRELGFSPGVLGLIFAVGGVTSLLGALIAGRTTRRFGLGPAMIVAMLLIALGELFIPLARDATLLAAALLVAQQLVTDPAWTVYEITQVSIRQAITPERLLGRVNAGMRFSELGAMLLGTLAGGALGEWLGLRATLLAGCGGIVLGALWLLLSPVRVMQATPTPFATAATHE